MKTNNHIPVVKNEYYQMNIDDIGINGEGIGKIDGYTLFVPGALPNESIKVKVIKTNKNYGFGKLIEILKPSVDRREAKCGVFSKCGGCQLQHLSYEATLRYKKEQVINVLKRIGGLNDNKVNDVIGMKEPYYYRNKVQMPIGFDKGEIVAGFYAKQSHRIVPIDTCVIQKTINDDIVSIVKSFMDKYHIQPYNEVNHKGLIRHIVIRNSNATNEINVTLVINGTKIPMIEALIDALRSIEEIKGICLNINKGKTNVIFGKKTITIWGQAYITDSIGELTFKISPMSFYQVNPIQTEKLYNKALDFAKLTGEEIVWDAYCGIGTITLFLAKQAKTVYGVEIIKEAIEDARQNAIDNNIENAKFYVGAAEEIIPKLYHEEGVKADVIVVDPPRKGCDQKLLHTMLQMSPDRIVYVSCNPATLARDLKVLVDGGYEVGEVQPVDMFPWSGHVETIVLLQKKSM